MVGGAPAVLDRRRTAALAALAVALGVYFGVDHELWRASTWWDVAWIALVVIPAVFGLVYLVLPLRGGRGFGLVTLALVAVAVVTTATEAGAVADFAKLAATTAVAFWFLTFFEELWLVVVIAAIIPWVDAWSVWRGPTRSITKHHPGVFSHLSFAFPIPGERGTANLGLPDLLFFALFLAAAAQFRLRVKWSWVAMTLSFGATLAFAVWLDLSGLPALPGLSIGFLGVNADLIWRRLRRSG